MTTEEAPASGWRNRIVGTGTEDPEQLLANPRNWRIHPRKQQAALTGALDTVGWVQQVMVNRRTGYVVDGHARIEVALARHEREVPVIYVDLSSEEEALVLATLDPMSGLAGTDDAKLAELLGGISVDDAGLLRMLEGLGRKPQHVIDPDAIPDVGPDIYVQPGDLWQLGRHRLLCGDATETAAYGRLLAGERATMAFLDPPWNVAIGQDSNPRHRQRTGLINDDLDAASFRGLLDGFARETLAVLDGDLYCVLGASEWPTLDLALRGAGFHWSSTIIWVKYQFVLGRSNLHRRYEPIWYGWRAGKRSSYDGGRDQDDVWEFDRPQRSPEHPTMKPVALVERAIANSSRTSDIVLDSFAGAGTTLIAAEGLGRRCFAMEIAPQYVQVVIERWQAYTGARAVRVDG